ncbi:hypothetical protein F4604DRAFT_2023274 [Suillus subluteus]|nr:hypothetical protein F4604DRAFT_2023274 [Suillus subluteus]
MLAAVLGTHGHAFLTVLFHRVRCFPLLSFPWQSPTENLASLEVAGVAVYLREPVFMFPRDNGDHGDDGDDDGSSTTSTSTIQPLLPPVQPPPPSSTTTTSTSTFTSTSTSQSSSSSSSATTTSGTLTSFSSSYTSSSNSSQNNGSSTTSQGLSTGARTGLALGISELTLSEPFSKNIDSVIPVFLLIFCAILGYYLRKRSRRARESVGYGPALLPSEVSQYRPPDSVVSRERDLPPPPPPQLDTAYLNSPDISHASSLSAISSATPLLSDDSHLSSHPISTWNRYSTLSQASDSSANSYSKCAYSPKPLRRILSTLPDLLSYTSTASSPTHSIPQIPASAAMDGHFCYTSGW